MPLSQAQPLSQPQPVPPAQPAAQSQPVLAPPAMAAVFLVVTVRPGAEDDVREALADVPALNRAVGFRVPEAALSCVVGVGSRVWDGIYGAARPAHLHPFPEVRGAVHTAIATPGDLLFHVRAARQDLCFELTRQLMVRFRGLVDMADETHGFRYFDERDLLGFVDGTENPQGAAAQAAVFVGGEDPQFAGGSYVVVQKYLHDLDAWNALSVEDQERVVGRTKLDDIELSDAEQPSNSHVALNTVVDDDGTERDIVRDNLPFGRAGSAEFGTYFIGYAADPGVTEQMLRNMFIGNPIGNHDRILDFSRPVTGCLFFVPPLDLLEGPPQPATGESGGSGPGGAGPDDTAPDKTEPDDTEPDDTGTASGTKPLTDTASFTDPSGSLGIGSLRRGTS